MFKFFAIITLMLLPLSAYTETTSLEPDFESEDASGTVMSATDMVQAVERAPEDLNKTADTSLLSVSVAGDHAEITQRYVMNTLKSMAGQNRNQCN